MTNHNLFNLLMVKGCLSLVVAWWIWILATFCATLGLTLLTQTFHVFWECLF